MMRDQLRVGVAGLGPMGMIHVRNALASSEADLVAVAAARPGRADEVAAQMGPAVRPMGYEELFTAPDVDAVVIATQTWGHPEHAVAALRGEKHVLLEKPGATSLAGIELIEEEAGERPDQILRVAYMRRHDPLFVELKRVVTSGEIGEPFAAHMTSRETKPPDEDQLETGGFIMDLGVHDMDTARWLLGDEPVSVFTASQRHAVPHSDMDNAYLNIAFQHGRFATCNLARTSVVGHDIRCEVVGTAGAATLSQVPSRGQITVTTRREAGAFPSGFAQRWETAYRRVLDDFVEACLGRPSAGASIADDRTAVATVVAARASAVAAEPLDVGPDWAWEPVTASPSRYV